MPLAILNSSLQVNMPGVYRTKPTTHCIHHNSVLVHFIFPNICDLKSHDIFQGEILLEFPTRLVCFKPKEIAFGLSGTSNQYPWPWWGPCKHKRLYLKYQYFKKNQWNNWTALMISHTYKESIKNWVLDSSGSPGKHCL